MVIMVLLFMQKENGVGGNINMNLLESELPSGGIYKKPLIFIVPSLEGRDRDFFSFFFFLANSLLYPLSPLNVFNIL